MARTIALAAGTLLFTLLVPLVIGLLVPLALVQRSGAAPTPLWPLGALVAAGGATLYVWCAASFVVVGRGTPAPIAAPVVFVARGPYRVVRNPMYVAVIAAVLGEALAFGSDALVAYAGFLAIAFHLFVVLYEEPTLTARFGASYEDYRRRVPRWLPHLRRSGRSA